MAQTQDYGKSGAAGDAAAAAEVYYDGGCPLCRAEIEVYRRAASDQVRWRDVDQALDGTAASDLPSRDRLLARFHARRADGRLESGAAAFVAVWRAVPRLAWLARILDRQPFLAVGDALYFLFLKLRKLWRRQ